MSSRHPVPKPAGNVGMKEHLRPDRFSTAIVAADRQVEYWQKLMSPLVDVEPAEPAAGGFKASCRRFDFGVVQIATLKSEPMHFARSGPHADPAAKYWCLTVLRRGSIDNRVGGTKVEVAPGTILINSLADSFSGTTGRIECINLLMNRDFFFNMEADIDALINICLEGPVARILSDFVLSSEKLFTGFTISETSLWIESFSHLLGAVLKQQRGRQPFAPGPRDRASTVLAYIRDNLHSPTLGAQSICQALRMSRRQLYYLLAPYGGVARLITRKRLVAACKALARSEDSRLISTVAYSLGFSDHAVFCKQFREEFGFSPSDARDSSICGYLPRQGRRKGLAQWLSDDAPSS